MGMLSRGRGKGKMMLLILSMSMLLILLAGFRSEAEQSTTAAPTAADYASSDLTGLPQSLELLALAGQEVTAADSPLRLVLKWQGEYSGNTADSFKDADMLAEQLGIEKTEASEEDGHRTYRASGTVDSYSNISLFWSELGPETSYVIVTVETLDLRKAVDFQSVAEKAGTIMLAAGIHAEWNVSLQGLASLQGSPRETVAHIEKTLASRLSGLTAVENYKDDATYSSSYSVPGIERYVNSGEHKLALQAAVHKNSNDDSNRVTIGLPIITIEY